MKNNCIDCGEACSCKRCRKCQDKRHSKMMKGKNNYFFGKCFIKENSPRWKGNLAVKRKIYYCKELDCNNKICYETYCRGNGRCKSCSKKGNLNSMVGKSGKLSPVFGRICNSPKKVKYKGIWMRSNWEKLYALYLDKCNIIWTYESKRFDLGNSTYTPDFYLPKFDKYIEIKGQFSDYAKNKINKFRDLYPNVNFEILREHKLKQLGVLK